ncbi:MAG: class II aldolase, partial [Pseudomonadota bacterium]|nr:class II aldolase [Pseudomonadota bacterium]
ILAGIRTQAAHVTRQAGGSLAWPGIKRRVERRFPGYDK